jgi:hypothetical protein
VPAEPAALSLRGIRLASNLSGKALRMANDPDDWLQQALDVYRIGRLELEKWRTIQPADVKLEIYIEELKDELFELKQAIFGRDVFSVEQCKGDIGLLILEIRMRSEVRE